MTDRPPPETVHVPDGPLEPSQGVSSATPPASGSGEHAAGKGHFPTFGRFVATAQLGAGAMGTVYRAHDDVLGRDVAIKALTCDDGLGTRERFLREARAIGAVQHANILGIYDASSDANPPYLVVELATQGTLRDRIKNAQGSTPVSVEAARDVGVQIARALAAAHAAGIIHRDVKPANILATRDASGAEIWKLADFGIARTPDSTLTVTGQFIGSPSYAAPESLREGKFSAASDVYGLAATLYEALSGSPPHGDHDMRSVIRKLDHEAPALSTKRADVPGPIGAAIMAGLARDPDKRPDADHFAKLLAAVDDKDRVPPVPATPRAPISPRLKLVAGALVAVAVALLAIAFSHRGTSLPSPLHASPIETTPARDQAGQPQQTHYDDNGQQLPQIVDENGNPVDEETAKQILEQMQHDAEEEMDHPGRGHKKHKPHE